VLSLSLLVVATWAVASPLPLGAAKFVAMVSAPRHIGHVQFPFAGVVQQTPAGIFLAGAGSIG
jgi:hypothetical protein